MARAQKKPARGRKSAASAKPAKARQVRYDMGDYRRVFERGLDAIAITTLPDDQFNVRYLDVNDAFVELSGYRREELIGKSPVDVGIVRSTDVWSEASGLLRQGARVHDHEGVFVTRGGREITLLYSVSTVVFRKKPAVVTFMRDITERKHAEQRIRELNDQLREKTDLLESILQSMGDAVFVSDRERRVARFNKEAQRLFGSDLTGMSPEEFARRFAVVDENGRSAFDASGLWQGTALRDENSELRARRADGAEVWLSATSRPVVDMRGELQGVVSVLHDVTAERRVLEELRGAQEQAQQLNRELKSQAGLLQSIWDCVGEAIIVSDVEGKITQLNPKGVEMYGSDLLGLSMEQYLAKYPPEKEDGSRYTIAELLTLFSAGDHGRRTELYFRNLGGSGAWVSLDPRPLTDEEGKPRGTVTVVTNITERKLIEQDVARARDAALEAARLREDFLANMSHEIRTPMNGVMGMTRLLLESPLTPEQREFAEAVRDSADHMLMILNDILDFSKASAGKLQFDEVDFDLRAAVEGALDVFVPQACAKGLEIVCLVDPALPPLVRGDPGRLRQVLTNLIGNAVKFTEHGHVAVTVHPLEHGEAGALRFRIHDTGIGIPKQALPRLFNPFVQADGSTTRKFGGTGLGLAICAEIVKRMGGAFTVNSAPGAGSTFEFTARFTPAAEARPAYQLSGLGFGDARTLIVDDNQSSLDALRQLFSAWRIPHDGVSSGAEALQAMHQAAAAGRPYRIAVMDMEMPEMSGLQLARAIRQDPAIAAARLLLLHPIGKASAAEMRAAGVDAWLAKPIKQSQLFDHLLRLVTPAAAAPPFAPRSTSRDLSAASSGLEHLRILVAEDNITNQKVARGLLRRLGCTAVDTVANGAEALHALATVPYDVVLMDCQMPEMDGYEATARIRQREADAKHTVVIAMTAHAMAGEREKCLRAGMDDYLTKPVRLDELAAVLKQWAPKPLTHNGESAAGGSPIDLELIAELRAGDDGLLHELIDTYLEELNSYLPVLRNAVADGDWPAAERLAHMLKGSSGSIGAAPLAAICAGLELKARDSSLEGAGELMAQVEREVERVRVALAAERH